MGKIRLIKKVINNNYDLLIVFVNSLIYDTNGINVFMNNYRLNKYISNKYKTSKINVGDIIVTPGFHIKEDIMFIRIPTFDNVESKKELLNICDRVMRLIMINEYKEILMPNFNLQNYGYENIERYLCDIATKYIENKDINIDLTKN